MQAIVAGDVRAFESLYDRYGRLVYSTAYRVLSDAQLAEDVAQEVFVRIWRRPSRYVEERGRFLGWLLSVTRNRAIDELRARARRSLNEDQIIDQPRGAYLAGESSAAEFHRAELVEQRGVVREALRSLPDDQRVAIELAYYRGLTQVEIAEALQTPLGTIKTRMRLGMHKLRAALDGRIGTVDIESAPDRPERQGGGR